MMNSFSQLSAISVVENVDENFQMKNHCDDVRPRLLTNEPSSTPKPEPIASQIARCPVATPIAVPAAAPSATTTPAVTGLHFIIASYPRTSFLRLRTIDAPTKTPIAIPTANHAPPEPKATEMAVPIPAPSAIPSPICMDGRFICDSSCCVPEGRLPLARRFQRRDNRVDDSTAAGTADVSAVPLRD